MREAGLWSAEDGLDAAFADARAAGCRFGDCAHGGEPGCAVRAAVDRGEMAPARLESRHRLHRELAWLETRRDEAAQAAQEKAFRAHRRHRHGG